MARPCGLGIEIGGTKLQLGIGRGDGTLIAFERFTVDPARGPLGILTQIQAGFLDVLKKAHLDQSDVTAVGVGFGGPVDSAAGRVQKSYQVAGWDDFPLADWLREHLGVASVAVENDCDSAALAEARLGAGIGYSPLLYVTVGSGVGGALIIDDRIYRGFGLGAVEIGHLIVGAMPEWDGPVAELEQVSSGWGIASAAQAVARRKLASGANDWLVLTKAHGEAGRITAAMVAEAAIQGDAEASSILDRARRAFAFALTQAITLLAPRRIVMGGGVSLIGEATWFEPIRRLVDANVFGPFKGRIDLVPPALGEEVVVHGALIIASDRVQVRP
jgi:glucokinase